MAVARVNMPGFQLLIAVALIVTWAGVPLSPAQKRSMDEPRSASTLSLEDYLLTVGEQYDFYFTLETGWQVPEHMNWMEQYRVVRQFSTEESIQQHLEMLKETVPHFTYTFDYANHKVIHIKDARLAQQPAYGMDGVLKSINYKGSWIGLVNTLGEQGIKVSASGVIWIGDPRARDYSTQVDVEAQNITGRDAITNFIQVQGRRRILWLSTTKLSHGEWSYIQLYAPVKKPRS